MARSKATITLDREKAERARELAGADSISDVVDLALERLVAEIRLRRDIAAYRNEPLSEAERALGNVPVAFDLDDDDVDYEALYGEGR